MCSPSKKKTVVQCMCVYVCTYVCRCVHIDNSSIVQFLYNVSLIEEKGWRERCFFFKSGISLPHTYHTHTTPHACACLNGMRSRAKRFTSLYRVLSRTAPSLRKQKTTTKETKTWLWRARRRNHPPQDCEVRFLSMHTQCTLCCCILHNFFFINTDYMLHQ